jgi:hypothetical protein
MREKLDERTEKLVQLFALVFTLLTLLSFSTGFAIALSLRLAEVSYEHQIR